MGDLVGRGDEKAALDHQLDVARQGLSSTVVLRGEPGVGKTALIDDVVSRADDFLVVRFTGLESERDLGYAALHRLLTPILHQIDRLPTPQRDALNSALGLADGPPPNPFLVGLATISLAANAARARHRLLTVIDDAHWVDRESLEALAFWGRRIRADGIALIFAARNPGDGIEALGGFETIDVRGLPPANARKLLERELMSGVDGQAVTRAVLETGGNPLALIELARSVGRAPLAMSTLGPEPLPIGTRLEEHFGRRVGALPADTQMLLLLAAADSSSSTALVWRAASALRLASQAAEAAEAEGLLTIGAELRFTHPLIRSAVYRSARAPDRRAAHRALADATGDGGDDRHAWHRAAATIGPDDGTAALLDQRAQEASRKGRRSTAAALFGRAAELTPEASRAAERYVAAAGAATDAALPLQALAFLERAELDVHSDVHRAEALRIRATASVMLSRSPVATELFLESARLFASADPTRARPALLEALVAAHLAGRLGSHRGELSDAITLVTTSSVPTVAAEETILQALSAHIVESFTAAVPQLRAAVDAITSGRVPVDDVARWNIVVSRLARSLWDQTAHEEILTRVAQVARQRGHLEWLATTLQALASNALWRGEFVAAESLLEQASDVIQAMGGTDLQRAYLWMELRAWRGDVDQLPRMADSVMQLADASGMASSRTYAHIALARLHVGRAQYADAKQHARAVFDEDPPLQGNDILDDLIEAAIRTDDAELAQLGLDRLADRAEAAGSPWALGVLARARALVIPGRAEECYRDAIALLADTQLKHDLARTQLLYGEWLRRGKRRRDAREQLRVAYESFAAMGAEGFAQRAFDELRATGEHARRRSVETAGDLTPQEAHVAVLAAGGDTNAEIAAQLYISVNTVEYHLRKVYRKLDITSRRDLRRTLPR